MRRLAILVAPLAALALTGPLMTSAGTGVSPAAAPRDPVPAAAVSELGGGLKDRAFNALPARIRGYVEHEYLIHGTARAYDVSPTALSPAGTAAPAVTAPYASRMVVRRPRNPDRFNGTVVVEWMNVTSGYDVEASWVELRRQIVRSGAAYVGVTAQKVGAEALRAYDAVRYAGVVHPGDQFSYDIFAQAARALRTPDADGPLGPMRARRVLATGASQSGGALNNFVTSVQPRVQRVIDGFLVMTSNEAIPDPEVPVLRVLTEWEAAGLADTRHRRDWEIAGASHVDKYGADYFAKTQSRDFEPVGDQWLLTPKDLPNCLMGRYPKFYVMNAALRALERWVAHGRPAPHAPRLKTRADGSLARDPRTGNTLGGIRLPAADAPVASYYGESENECVFTFGKTLPFSQQMIEQLYPTHATYVRRVRASARVAVADGFLLRADARIIVRQARGSAVGRP